MYWSISQGISHDISIFYIMNLFSSKENFIAKTAGPISLIICKVFLEWQSDINPYLANFPIL